jgi:biotin-(acetyl-CoA carboxylase) ligase
MARPESVPSEIKDRFGSLFESCDEKMYPVFVSKLYQSLSNVLNRSKDEILREYRIRLVHLGKPITIFQNNVPISGDMYGITDDFALLVETKNGIESFSSGYMILE